jgi:hypothetical protein
MPTFAPVKVSDARKLHRLGLEAPRLNVRVGRAEHRVAPTSTRERRAGSGCEGADGRSSGAHGTPDAIFDDAEAGQDRAWFGDADVDGRFILRWARED